MTAPRRLSAPQLHTLRAMRPALCALLLLAPLPCLVGCSPGSRSHARFDGAVLPPGVRAHEFTLTAQDGRSVSLRDSHGRVRMLAFLSSSKRGSLLVAQQMRGALDELSAPRADVSTLIVSIDPSDTRARIERFLKASALGGRAQYLTGSPAQLRAIWKAYGVLPASAGEAAFLSSTPILLVDRAGIERVGFPVEQLTPEGLAHDLRALLAG
jgi:protein SCO1